MSPPPLVGGESHPFGVAFAPFFVVLIFWILLISRPQRILGMSTFLMCESPDTSIRGVSKINTYLFFFRDTTFGGAYSKGLI